MGLKSKEMKKIQLRLEMLELLSEYGIEPSDLHYLHEAVEYVKSKKNEKPLQNDTPRPVLDEKTKKAIKEKYDGKMTPEEFIQQFTGESEEFYPYGKPKKDNN